MSYPFIANQDILYSYVPVALIICPPDVDINLEHHNLGLPSICEEPSEPKPKAKLFSRKIIVEGMAFTLSVERPVSAHTNRAYENLFAPTIPIGSQVLGLTLGQHLVGGKHLAPVNTNLLLTARKIGGIFGATGFVWCPARLHVDFGYFSEACEQYAADAVFPILLQISTIEPCGGQLETRGLRYFAGIELRLLFPPHDTVQNWMTQFLQAIRVLIAGIRLNESSSILQTAPHGTQLAHCHQKGMVLEVSYSADEILVEQSGTTQAALGAASRTF